MYVSTRDICGYTHTHTYAHTLCSNLGFVVAVVTEEYVRFGYFKKNCSVMGRVKGCTLLPGGKC